MPHLLGTNTVTQNLYGRVFSGQQNVQAGVYLSAFGSTDAEIKYGLVGLGCGLLTLTATTTFNVTATVPTTCSVATNNLDFGTAGTLTTNNDASTTLSPTCTSGTAYNIGLNGGLSGATDPTQRKMTKAAEFVLYGYIAMRRGACPSATLSVPTQSPVPARASPNRFPYLAESPRRQRLRPALTTTRSS